MGLTEVVAGIYYESMWIQRELSQPGWDNFRVCFSTEVGSNLGRNKFTFRYDDKSQLLADAAAVVARRLLCTTAFKELIRAKFRRKVFFDSKSRGTILRMAYL